MTALRPLNLRRIDGAGDGPHGLCAHGGIAFRVGADAWLDASNGRDVTASAGALYLLRTPSAPHAEESPAGGHLFPCRGLTMYDTDDREDVETCGGPSGADSEVRREGGGIVLRSAAGREDRVGGGEWRSAVFAFADRVSESYADATPEPPGDEIGRPGSDEFAAEWRRRRGEPLGSPRPILR